MTRILLAGLLGGLAVFAWESIAHLALPLGDAGIKPLANEQAVVTSLKDNIKDAGFYFFPAPTPQNANQQGFTGIMVVKPNGTLAMAPGQLLTQAGADVVAMIVAAVLLALAPIAGFGKRVLFVTLMGGRRRGPGEADQDSIAGIGPHRDLDRLTPVSCQSRLETKQSKQVVV